NRPNSPAKGPFVIELTFPTIGSTIPTDHGYALYGALSRIVPALHDADSPVRIGPIRGAYAGNGVLNLDRRFSFLRLRLPADQIAQVLPLAGCLHQGLTKPP